MQDIDLTKIKGPKDIFIQGEKIGDAHRIRIDENGNVTVYSGF